MEERCVRNLGQCESRGQVNHRKHRCRSQLATAPTCSYKSLSEWHILQKKHDFAMMYRCPNFPTHYNNCCSHSPAGLPLPSLLLPPSETFVILRPCYPNPCPSSYFVISWPLSYSSSLLFYAQGSFTELFLDINHSNSFTTHFFDIVANLVLFINCLSAAFKVKQWQWIALKVASIGLRRTKS